MRKMREYRVAGFRFAGITAGIKEAKVPDLALIVSDVPAQVVGCFTTNKVQAAPVTVSKKNIRSGVCRAVIVNSGNANACTGMRGRLDAEKMVATTAGLLQVPRSHVLVSSTGKIGVPLPIDRIVKKIPEVVRSLSLDGFSKAATAILTTDHSAKIASATGTLDGKTFHILGCAKGAGMISPEMAMEPHTLRAPRASGISSAARSRAPGFGHATMLAYIMTDAVLTRPVMKVLFKNCVAETFNAITVDGDTSTNDTALFLANGLAGNEPFELRTPECRRFAAALFEVMETLAKAMVKDGEGATKCVRIEVKGARSHEEARKIAETTANSPLVKTSFFGQDPNWGRVLGAVGRAGVRIHPEKIDVFYGDICVARNSRTTGPAKEKLAKRLMKQPEFTVTIDCHLGPGCYGLYASDLTLDYVKLNSCYRT